MADDAFVNVPLPQELADLVDEAVANGGYSSAADVVAEALLQWREGRKLSDSDAEALCRLWDEGIASGPGRFKDMAGIKAEARRQFEARKSK